MDGARLEKVVQQAAAACGVQLYHLDWLESGRRNILRIYIDKPEGVTVGDCEHVSRELDVLLDVEDLIRVKYVLEVSSPGLDRRLYIPAHYQAQIGRAVEVRTLRTDAAGRRKWVGILTAAGDDGFTVEVEDGERLELRYADVESCRLQITI